MSIVEKLGGVPGKQTISEVVEPGGSGGIFVVTGTIPKRSSDSYPFEITCDKTVDELMEAQQQGKVIVLYVFREQQGPPAHHVCLLSYSDYMNGNFSGSYIDWPDQGGSSYMYLYTISAYNYNKSWKVSVIQLVKS